MMRKLFGRPAALASLHRLVGDARFQSQRFRNELFAMVCRQSGHPIYAVRPRKRIDALWWDPPRVDPVSWVMTEEYKHMVLETFS